MSSPDSDHVNIRIEISVPTGANVRTSPRTESSDLGRGFSLPLYVKVGNPGTGSTYGAFPNICVQPLAASALGSVALFFTYSTAPYAVKAIIYPSPINDSDSALATNAQPGIGSVGNTVWTWAALTWADHTATLGQCLNYVHLWTQATSTSAWVADSNTFAFYGYSGTAAPCGSGSTSASSIEEDKHHTLRVDVPDGPKAGRYTARPVAALKWQVVIGHTTYQIHLSPDGTTAFFSCPTTTVRSGSAAAHPVSAIFPGAIVGAERDVVVFQE